MSKQIQRDQEIYIAPEILGKYENNEPMAVDERNGNLRLNPKDLDAKITIYEREVNEWFLEPAFRLLEDNSFINSFIVLMVCMSYLEGVEQYKTGVPSNNRSKDCFLESINRLYPASFRSRDLKKLYDKSRCGLFHNGMVKGGVIFSNSYDEPLEFQKNGEIILVNPTKLLEDIREDFRNYIGELKLDNSLESTDHHKTLRENFNRMFSVL